MIALCFQDLDVYKLALLLQQDVFRISKSFPKEEIYSLTDQIRRSSRSVGANIAEAWRKRRYPAHFSAKLSDADGENSETQHWLATAHNCAYLDMSMFLSLIRISEDMGAKLGRMMDTPELWKPKEQ